jgi:hypothetical protein
MRNYDKDWKRTSIEIPLPLWRRARQVMMDYSYPGGLSRLVREGLEARVEELSRQPVSFEIAWRRVHGVDCDGDTKLACYGAQRTSTAQFLSEAFHNPELAQHFRDSRWNERTAELISMERRYRALAHLPVPTLWLPPPGWTAELESLEPPSVSWPSEHDEDTPADGDATDIL